MLRIWLAALAVGAVIVSCGCGCRTEKVTDGAGKAGRNGKAAEDMNAAVKQSFWGEERVTYTASSGWMAGWPVPDGEQWSAAPTDSTHVKFTYAGDRLVRQEGFDVAGRPMRLDMNGVRREWTYAAHGGVLEEALYDAEGKVARREAFRYDDGGRCVLRTLYEYDRKQNESTYTYNADGIRRTNRMELYGPDGSRINVLSETELWNPETKTWEIETDGAFPFGAGNS
ncbi:MAG: hypothetical protein JW889_12570 [Verrucomicrobia bacterium]|nr:hypothetical protein [Verrucomicrobiota bacterium]